jgi:exodeoxyribonuclease VII small subunit
MKKKQATERTFEAKLTRLEDIVRTLDEGASPLDEMLALYEEGMTLTKECSEVLSAAEQKVTELQKSTAINA